MKPKYYIEEHVAEDKTDYKVFKNTTNGPQLLLCAASSQIAIDFARALAEINGYKY